MLMSMRDLEKKEEGREEGRKEGRKEGREEVAINLIKNSKLTLEEIASMTEISFERVQELAKRA